MEGILTERRFQLSGIMNGADYREWDPATDRHIAARYGPDTMAQGKAACKAENPPTSCNPRMVRTAAPNTRIRVCTRSV